MSDKKKRKRKLNRATRLNNPGCVRTGKEATYVDMDGNIKVLKPTGRDSGGYAIFATPEEGLIQLSVTLDNYERSGRNTVRKILKLYAPESDGNDTSGYIAKVCRDMGIGPDTKLDLSNPIQKERLMRAIAEKEGAFHGDGRYTDDMFYRAARTRIEGAKRSPELVPIKGVSMMEDKGPVAQRRSFWARLFSSSAREEHRAWLAAQKARKAATVRAMMRQASRGIGVSDRLQAAESTGGEPAAVSTTQMLRAAEERRVVVNRVPERSNRTL